MHYVLEADNQPIMAGSLAHDANGHNWLEGHALPAIKETLSVQLHRQYSQVPDYFEIDAVPIVSTSFMAVLAAHAIDNLQVYPVRMTNPDRAGFNALNILGAVQAMDWQASEFILDNDQDPDDEVVESIQKLVLKTEHIQGFDCFRLAELPTTLIVTAEVAAAMATLNGIRLTAVSEWASYAY